jgi:hypothetical protein
MKAVVRSPTILEEAFYAPADRSASHTILMNVGPVTPLTPTARVR